MKELNKILTKLFDLVMINLVFILSCLPIVTIPISWTALVLLEMKKDDEKGYLIKEYLSSWKKTAKEVAHLVILSVVILLILGLIVQYSNIEILKKFQFVTGIILILFTFLLPLTVGRLQLKGKDNIKSILFIASNFPIRITMILIINTFILFLSLSTYITFYISLSIFTLVGFVLLAKLNAKLLKFIEDDIQINEVE